jgi:hypothetical protein
LNDRGKRVAVLFLGRLSLEMRLLFILALTYFVDEYPLVKCMFRDGGWIYSFDGCPSVSVK